MNSVGLIGSSILEWFGTSWSQNGGRIIEGLGIVVGTAKGLVRSDNQDRCVVARSSDGWVVSALCDGIGGLSDGARCAEVAICRFVESFAEPSSRTPAERLCGAADAANDHVHQLFSEHGGTTLAAITISPSGHVHGVTVGDSRIYTLSSKGRLTQISIDDTIAGELQRMRGVVEIQPEDIDAAARHLAQYVGMGRGMQPRVYDLGSTDDSSSILLTSDGVHAIGGKLLEQVAANAPNSYKLCTRLLQVSEWLGGLDNATLIVIPFPTSTSFQSAMRRGELLELWTPFGKLDLLGLGAARPTGPTATQEAPRSKPERAATEATNPDRLRTDRKRAQARKPRRRPPPPQLGMELIEQQESAPEAGAGETGPKKREAENLHAPDDSGPNEESSRRGDEHGSIAGDKLPPDDPGAQK